jgi:hypothetical protein
LPFYTLPISSFNYHIDFIGYTCVYLPIHPFLYYSFRLFFPEGKHSINTYMCTYADSFPFSYFHYSHRILSIHSFDCHFLIALLFYLHPVPFLFLSPFVYFPQRETYFLRTHIHTLIRVHFTFSFYFLQLIPSNHLLRSRSYTFIFSFFNLILEYN